MTRNRTPRLRSVTGALLAAYCLLALVAGSVSAAPPRARTAIVGGGPAIKFPAMADIVSDGTYYCGGTLVTPTKVVTAAHCVVDEDTGKLISAPARYDVVLGAHIDKVFGSAAQRSNLDHYKVASVVADPKYDFEVDANDAAVITLARRATEQPVGIIGYDQPQLDQAGVVGTIFGHGVTVHGGAGTYDASDVLKMTQETIVNTATCENALVDITVDFCGGGNGITGTCQGDSGGPFVVRDASGQFVLVGIVSAGPANGCAIKGEYDLFTRIRGTQVGTWLDTQVGSHAGPERSPPGPSITHLVQSHRTWREGNKLATTSSAQPPVGTTFSFTLNQRARVSLAFNQLTPARLVAGTCVPPTNVNHGNRACQFNATIGKLSFTAHPGTNKVSFQGRLSRSERLKPGHYTLYMTAIDTTGLPTEAQALSFTIAS